MRGLVSVNNQIERVTGFDLDGDGQVFRASGRQQPTARTVALILRCADAVCLCVVRGMAENRSAQAVLCSRSC